jgi:hypothetical protein
MNQVKVMTIHIPPIPYHNINFNPSIVHLIDSYFLISFHVFRRQYGHTRHDKIIASIDNPYHP